MADCANCSVEAKASDAAGVAAGEHPCGQHSLAPPRTAAETQ